VVTCSVKMAGFAASKSVVTWWAEMAGFAPTLVSACRVATPGFPAAFR